MAYSSHLLISITKNFSLAKSQRSGYPFSFRESLCVRLEMPKQTDRLFRFTLLPTLNKLHENIRPTQ